MILLAAFALSPIVSAEPTVTLRVPATSTGKILEMVKTSTGTDIGIAASFKEIPLIVSVKDIPLSAFLANMGQALNMAVEPTTNGFRLVRTQKMQAEMVAAQHKEYADQWTLTLGKWKAELDKAPWSTKLANALLAKEAKRNNGGEGAWEEYRKGGPHLDTMSPAARLLYKFMVSLGPDELARLDQAGHVVYSRFPNRSQKPLPSNFESWLKAYEKESSLNPPPPPQVLNREDWEDGRNYRPSVTTLQSIGKVHITFDHGSASLSIYNKEGTDMDGTDAPGMYDLDPFADDDDVSGPVFKDLTPITPSPLCKQLNQFVDASYSKQEQESEEEDAPTNDAPIPVSKELSDFLLNPEKTDPLSLLASEVLLAYADQKHLNLIAQIDDFYADPTAILPEEGGRDVIDMNQAMDSMIGNDKNLSTDPSWLVLRPENLLDTESRTVKRSATGAYARSSMKSGYNLEADINFCGALNSEYFGNWYYGDNPVDFFLADRLGPHQLPNLKMGGFLSTLGQGQRSNLGKGGFVQVASLNPSQLAALNEWVMDPSSSVADMSMWDEDAESQPQLYLSEITEMMPNGIPPMTTIGLSSDTRSGYSMHGQLTDAKYIAALSLMAAQAKPGDEEADMMTYLSKASFKAAQETAYIVKVTFAPKTVYTERITYQNPIGDGRQIPFKNAGSVPAIQQWMNQFKGFTREQLINVMSGGDGSEDMMEGEDE